MSPLNHRALLTQQLEDVQSARSWLERSYKQCLQIELKDNYAPEQIDALEVLTARYARTCDLIINKLFRGIDQAELNVGGSIIDIINRSHKRGLIESAENMRKLKELRNEIAYGYTRRQLQAVFATVIEATPQLFSIMERIESYCIDKGYTG